MVSRMLCLLLDADLTPRFEFHRCSIVFGQIFKCVLLLKYESMHVNKIRKATYTVKKQTEVISRFSNVDPFSLILFTLRALLSFMVIYDHQPRLLELRCVANLL